MKHASSHAASLREFRPRPARTEGAGRRLSALSPYVSTGVPPMKACMNG